MTTVTETARRALLEQNSGQTSSPASVDLALEYLQNLFKGLACRRITVNGVQTAGVWMACLVYADRGRHRAFLFDARASRIRSSPPSLAGSHDWLAACLATDAWFGPGPFVFHDEHRSATQQLATTAVHCLAWAEGRLRGWEPLIAHYTVDGVDDPDFAFVFPLATTAAFDRPEEGTCVFDLSHSETLDMVWTARYKRMQRTGTTKPRLPPVVPDAGAEKEAWTVERQECMADD
ncbi:hypothetical protein SBRCBS47491_009845 [Sporothrix bragantina]|uniref:Uncharacterized protein n=1 Tax=Sporothrix bragantina TaxID=671064 RepID=A0ABP0D1Q6_9PEZI